MSATAQNGPQGERSFQLGRAHTILTNVSTIRVPMTAHLSGGNVKQPAEWLHVSVRSELGETERSAPRGQALLTLVCEPREDTSQVEELAAAARRKDEFLATLSHELRSPLASIQYAVRLLAKQPGESLAQQRIRALIERQLERTTRLVADLLDLSSIARGRIPLQRERIDLRVILSNAIETLQADVDERRHRLTAALPSAPVWLQGDAARLEQVFVNLLANASRYTDDGGDLTISIDAPADEAVVRFCDSGIGIAPEALPHIFDLFRQASEEDSRSKAGLGIGLAVVRSLVTAHGGSVTAASAGCGRGSEFAVRLPTEG